LGQGGELGADVGEVEGGGDGCYFGGRHYGLLFLSWLPTRYFAENGVACDDPRQRLS
jgi:hypothetical protein